MLKKFWIKLIQWWISIKEIMSYVSPLTSNTTNVYEDILVFMDEDKIIVCVHGHGHTHFG